MRVLAKALVVFVFTCASVSKAAAQAAPTAPKDPGVATLVSVLVVGGGQMYTGEVKRGLTMLGVGLGSLIVGSALSVSSCDTEAALETGCSNSYAALGVGTVVYLGTWVYSMIDAPKSAARQNLRLQRARVIPRLDAGPHSTMRVGLGIQF